MFYTFILALSVVCVQCQIWIFFVVTWFSTFPVCWSGIAWVNLKWFRLPLWLPVSLLFFTFHKLCIYTASFLYFKIFSASFLITFLSPGIATSISMHVPCLLSRIMMSGLLLGMILSDRTFWFHNMVILSLWLISTDFSTSSFRCSLSNFTPIPLIC